jgi:antitoxin component YwqK of YwqJK toxin-antitoxin module
MTLQTQFLCFILSLIIGIIAPIVAQDTVRFYHHNGAVSSEGILTNGEPDGVWMSYSPQGVLVSTATWKNGVLDGLSTFYIACGDNAKFYNTCGDSATFYTVHGDSAKIVCKQSAINYKNGVKDGLSIYYNGNGCMEESYENGVKQGISRIYQNGVLIKETPYDKNLENGLEKTYTSARITTLTTYRKGLITHRENINRLDAQNQKQGAWKTFYSNNNINTEITYKNNLKNGYYKEYDTSGNLILLEKYENDTLVKDAPELVQMDVRTEYYANGSVKLKVGYKNNKPEGIMRVYDSVTGKITQGIIFKDGKQVGSGIIDDRGFIQGNWSDVYPNGMPKNKGKYINGRRSGHWLFYDPLGKVMQEGDYKNGKETDEWLWYFSNGNVRLRQNYENGLLNGLSEEYSDSGRIMARGQYVDGLEEGEWQYFTAGTSAVADGKSDYSNGERMTGKYVNGERTGEWRHYWLGKGSKLSFKGTFRDGYPNGRQTFYWESGVIRAEEFYQMGKRTGVWTKYDESGTPIVRVKYDKNEEESHYNGKKTLPKGAD